MEKSLDEIIAGKSQERRREGRTRRGGAKGSSRRGPIKSSRGSGSGRRGNAVLITNLSSQISENDLRDLFRNAGPIISVTVDHDDKRRKGYAWVLYEFAADAQVAVGRFNNRSAAGQLISVQQVEHVGDLHAVSALKDRLGGAGTGAGTDKKGRGNGRGRNRRKGEKQAKTAEELDAELDSYMTIETDQPQAATGNGAGDAGVGAASVTEPAPAPMDDLMIE